MQKLQTIYTKKTCRKPEKNFESLRKKNAITSRIITYKN